MKQILLFLSLCFVVQLSAQEPTRWRKDGSNGIYDTKNVLKVWPGSNAELVWSYEDLGEGHSSVAISNGKLYLTSMKKDSIGVVTVLSKDGKLIREYDYGIEYYQSFPGSRSTPVIAGDKIYLYTGMGELVCLNAETGADIWRKNVLENFDGLNIRWGVTETPVIDGDKIYISPGGKKNNVIALNRHTGDMIWSCAGNGEVSAYCTPLLVNLSARKLLVTMMASHIIGIDADNGQLLWSHHQPNKWSVHANTPIYHDGALVCISGYGQGSVKLKLSADGSKVTQEWFADSLDSRMGGAVLLDGYLYASGDTKRGWMAVDWETGKLKYFARELGKGNVISADGMLYIYTEKGELALVKADPKGFNVLSENKITLGSAQHWSHPVIEDDLLLLRHGTALMAFKIK